MNQVIHERTRTYQIPTRRIVNAKVVFTVSFVLGLLLLVVLRTNSWRLPLPSWIASGTASTAAGPEDAIYGMLDAARAGDTKFYLDAFSGTLRDQLLQVMKENIEPDFAAYLKSQNAAFQGVAVSVTDRPSDTEAQLRVEYVYSNRNEVQNIYLRKDARWRIVKVAGSEQVKTLLPFGSAVTD
jgi:hypothetical protein